MSVKPFEKRRTQIAALLSGPDKLSDRKIAEIVGCSTKTVERTRAAIKPAVTEIEPKLEEYRKLLRKELPLEDRARRYRELAKQDSQLMVSLKALERMDSLDGFVGQHQEASDSRQP